MSKSEAVGFADSLSRDIFLEDAKESQSYLEKMVHLRVVNMQPPRQIKARPKKVKLGPSHLIIGDAHSQPDVSNARFDWLGRAIAELQPDVIIDIGDWWSMDSLCSFDEHRADFKSRLFRNDIEAGIDAMQRVQVAIRGVKGYRPRKIRTLGNHEYRIERLIEWEPRFSGILGYASLASKEFGWEEIPFLDIIEVDGMHYTHYLKQVGSNRPVAGVVGTRTVALKHHKSLVFGHTHRYEVYEELQSRIQVINVGCYFEHWMDWAKGDNHRWNRGLLHLTDIRDGVGSPKWYSMEEVKHRWS